VPGHASHPDEGHALFGEAGHVDFDMKDAGRSPFGANAARRDVEIGEALENARGCVSVTPWPLFAQRLIQETAD